MSQFLKQSTEQIIRIGPFLDKGDGFSEEAGLAGTGTEISKGFNAAFGAGPVLGTYDADGWYPMTLSSTHTNTLGPLTIKVHDAATHLPVWKEYTVLPANVYDSLIGGIEWLEVTGLRADFSISGNQLTVKEQNGSDTQFTKTLTTTPGADPITGLD